MRVSIDMSELDDLADVLQKAPAQAESAVHAVTLAEGKAVHTRAKAGAPRDRPWLASRGIRRKSRKEGGGSTSNVFTVPDPRGRPVGFFVEYGTSRMPPQAFMEPAIAPSQASYPAAVLAAIEPFSNASTGGTARDVEDE
jgi:HK97 gp10 family phage protein